MIPKEFFVTGGRAVSRVSPLNAFDTALERAGIGQCNLVPVSSILPPGCRERAHLEVPVGSITHVVMARMDGEGGAVVGAGIAWGWERDGRYGLVAEAYGNLDEDALKEALEARMGEMARARGIEVVEVKQRVEVLRVPRGGHGCVVVALVYAL